MKNILVIITSILLSQFTVAQEYKLIPAKSSTEWVGYGEVGGFKQVGSINLKEGSITLENKTVDKGTVVFDAKSINHENKDLKKHLKARDFFHVKKHPEITFEITSTNKDKVFGTLSIRGVSLEEVFTFEMIQKEGFVIFAGEAKIDRTKYGIKYNSSAYFQDLGNYAIKNEFDLNFRLVFQKPQDMMN